MKKPPFRKFRVLVVDQEPLARSGLVSMIGSYPTFRIVGEAETPQLARDLALKARPEVIFVDLGMAESLLSEMHKLAPKAALVAMVRRVEATAMQRAFAAGATCYLSRLDSVQTYLEAAIFATIGRRFVGPCVEARLIDAIATGTVKLHDGNRNGLSKREREIFTMLGEGLKTGAVAERLGLSVKTIETHQARMKEKLGVKSMAGLVQQAVLDVAMDGKHSANR